MADAKTWSKRVSVWRSSGETAAVFASKGDFAPSTLKYWAWRLKRGETALVRVVREVEPAVAQRESPIEIEVGGLRVLVRAGFDGAALGQVLEVVRVGHAR